MNKLIDLYKRLNSFIAYNLLLYANFSLLLIVVLNVPFLISKVYILLVAYLLIGIAGYIINDYFDVEKDRLSNKFNITRIINKHWLIPLVVILIAIGLKLVALVSKYALYVVYFEILLLILYSYKSTRLKEKGFLGVLTDAAYAHILPSIIIVQLLSEHVTLPYWFWLIFICSNSCVGIRDILIHQSNDFEKDVKSKTVTFYTKYISLAKTLIFWFEVLTSILLLLLIGALYLQSNLTGIILVFAFMLVLGVLKLFNGAYEINYIMRCYMLSSSLLILYLSPNKIGVLLLFLHPYIYQFINHFIKNFNSNILGSIKRIRSLIHHIYKSKITLFINYLLYYTFLLGGRDLKNKPLYKKKD